MRFEQQRCLGLAHSPLDLLRGIFLLRAMLCQCLQFAQGVGRFSATQDRLEHAQRDQVGKATVRCGGVRVVAHRQAEVADRCGARLLHHVLARAHQLDDDQRQVRKAQRVGLVAPREKGLERMRIRLLGQ